MRFQKLLILFLVVSLSLSLAIVAQSRVEASDAGDSARVENDAENAARQVERKAAAEQGRVEREVAKRERAGQIAADKTEQLVLAQQAKTDRKAANAGISTIASASDDAANDRLLEALRNKQNELDAKESTGAKSVAPAAHQNSKPENFFREKTIVPSQPTKAAETVTTLGSAPASGDDLIEILRRKQAELDARQNSGKTQESVVAAPKPAKPVAVVSQPAVAPETQDRLMEILRGKQAELDAQESHSLKKETAPVAPKSAQAAETKVRAHEGHPAQPQVTVPEPRAVVSQPALTPQSQDHLIEILRKKQAEMDAKAGVVVETARPVEKPSTPVLSEQAREKRIREIEAEIKAKEEAFKKASAKKAVAKKSAASTPVPTKKEEAMKAALSAKTPAQPQNNAAPSLQPGSKEARLAELLRKYKADEITPHEYHSERAKIVAEP